MQIDTIEYLNDTFYRWACDRLSTTDFKRTLEVNGLQCDLRQADIDNTLNCYEATTGSIVILEC